MFMMQILNSSQERRTDWLILRDHCGYGVVLMVDCAIVSYHMVMNGRPIKEFSGAQ
jgi:hypothetical protein